MNNPFHVLLVEDDEDDVDLLKQAFQDNKISCQMDVVSTGDKVISWLEKCGSLPNIIVLDLNLPKMHGRDVLKLLKGHHSFKTIPVMVLTTSSSTDDIEFCLNAGAEKYLSKPSTIEGFKVITDTITSLAG